MSLGLFIDIITGLGSILGAMSDFIPKVVTFCAVISALSPQFQDGVFGKAMKVINILAVNVGYAKNAQ